MLLDHPRLASVMVCCNALMASLQDLPLMEVTAVRAASQCMFHHQRPQRSGVCWHLKNFPKTAYMSVSRASAAQEREAMSEISGIGNEAKSLVQEATRESSITKPGSKVGT